MATAAHLAERARVLHALRSRDFRLLWSGQTVSLVGDSAFLVALGWRAFDLTGSGAAFGLVLMASSAAMIATLLIGGALADRYERRTLMVCSDLIRAAVVAGLATVEATGHQSLPLLVAFAVGVGLGDGFFQPAFGGIVPLVVEQTHLASANSLIGLSRNGSLLVGPAFAGLAYHSAGPATVFGIDAGSFVVSALLVSLARPRAVEPEPSEGMFREIATGFRYVIGIPWLWATIAIASIVLMIGVAPFQALLPKLVEQHYHRGVGAYGLLFTLMGAGMVVGAGIFGQLNPRRSLAVTYALWAGTDLCRLLIAVMPAYALAAGVSVVRGVLISFSITMWETMLMERVPENRLARVISLDWFGSAGLLPVGYGVAAALSLVASPMLIITAGAGTSVALWLAALASGRLRVLR